MQRWGGPQGCLMGQLDGVCVHGCPSLSVSPASRHVSASSVSCLRMANRSSQGQGLGSLLLAEGSERLREQADFCPREDESSPLFFGPVQGRNVRTFAFHWHVPKGIGLCSFAGKEWGAFHGLHQAWTWCLSLKQAVWSLSSGQG